MPLSVVSLLGCGWLGLPLARHLTARGWTVKGSTTTAEKLPVLRHQGIQPFLLEFNPDDRHTEAADFFRADAFLIDVPFRRDLPDPQFYFAQMEAIRRRLAASPDAFVVFASSTSVYGDANGTVTETSPVGGEPRAQTLAACERLFLEGHPGMSAVIRFAGLYGPGREPRRFLNAVGRDRDGRAPVNLIHLDDCIEVVARVMERRACGIYNACSDGHPAREEFYSAVALKAGIPPPVLSGGSGGPFKIVSNDKLKATLRYQFRYPDPLTSADLV